MILFQLFSAFRRGAAESSIYPQYCIAGSSCILTPRFLRGSP